MDENPEAAFGGAGKLLGLIYSAVQQPELWCSVLEGIADAVHGESTTLLAGFPDEQLFSMTRTNPAAGDAHVSYDASVDTFLLRCDAKFPDGEVRYSHRARNGNGLRKTEFRNDFLKPYSMHYSLGLKVPLAHLPAAHISCQRPHAKGPFEEHEGLVYKTLLPHLQRALGLHMQMRRTQSHIEGMESALGAFDQAVLGVNRERKIVLVSRMAETLLRARDGIRVSNGELSARNSAQNARLKAAITEAASGQFGMSSASASVLIDRQSDAAPLQLTVVPHRSALSGRPVMAALVFIGDPARRSRSKAALLRAMYNLSPTEARIADLLAEGLTVREVTDRLGVALETARFHTKKILVKTGARRQAELMKLMVALPNL